MYPLAGPGLLAVRHTHLLDGSRAIGAGASIIHTGAGDTREKWGPSSLAALWERWSARVKGALSWAGSTEPEAVLLNHVFVSSFIGGDEVFPQLS